MKKIFLLLISALLWGIACQSKLEEAPIVPEIPVTSDEDIDISQIDFSNIENLYAQPLPVIQKAVLGKWKIYSSCGGVVGCTYPENSFTEFTPNEMINDNDNGSHYVWKYSWKKKNVQIDLDVYYETYILWNNGIDDVDDIYVDNMAGHAFMRIINDTLYSRSPMLVYTAFSQIYVRQK
jgi:hypothetical protein